MTKSTGMEKVRKVIDKRWFALAAIACVAFAIYSNTWHTPFAFDDDHTIEHNEKIQDLSNFTFPRAFLGARAVVNATFALNYHFGELNVFGYHLINILIHCANGFLVYLLTLVLLQRLPKLPELKKPLQQNENTEQRTSRKKIAGEEARGTAEERTETDDATSFAPYFIALFAALLFVAHPLQTQAVTYIAQRYTSLAAFFYMGAVFFYLKGRTATPEVGPSAFSLPPVFYYIASFFFGLLAFQSKQNAASLPLAIVLVEVIFLGGLRGRGWLRRLLWITPVSALFAAFVLYSMGLLGGGGIGKMLEDVSLLSRETVLVSRWSYLVTQFNVLVIYLRLLVFPIDQNLDYYYLFKTSFLDGFTPLAFAFLGGLAILAIVKRKHYPLFTFAIFWFFVTLSVESSIIPISDALYEHRMYLPLFGFALFFAWLPFRFLPKRRTLAVIICVTIVAVMGTATYMRNRVWKDELTLWADVLEKSPLNPRAALNIGNALAKIGRYDEAMRFYTDILRSNPDNPNVLYNIGLWHEKQEDAQGAIASYQKTLQVEPAYADARFRLANLLLMQNDYLGAERHYIELLRINPGNAEAHVNLGVAMTHNGNLDGALEHLSEAVRKNPKDAKARNNLGGILETRGDLEGAARRYAEALALNPDNSRSRTNLSMVLGKVGNLALAVSCYREALEAHPENLEIRLDFGITLSRLGDSEGAVTQFSEAVRLKPSDPKVRYNLGLAFFKQGKMDKAAEQYRESLRIEPKNYRAHYNLAIALYRSDDFAGAIKSFEAAMSLEPAMKANAFYDIARAYARQGKIEEATRSLKDAVSAGFNNWDNLKKDKDMENIRTTPYYRTIK